MKGRLGALIKAAVTLLLFYLLFRKMDFRQLGATMAGARLVMLLAAFLLLWVAHFICIFRWRMLMRPLMPTFSVRRLFEIYCIGLFFNLTFPTAVGGDVVKIYYAGKPSRLFAQSFAATFLDRDAGMLAMMIIAGTATLVMPVHVAGIPVVFLVWISFAAFIAVNIVIFMPSLHRLLTRILHRVRLSKTAGRVDAISSAFQVMGRHPAILLYALLISLINQFLVLTVSWVTAKALDLDVAFLYFLVVIPVITLISMIPISLNGYGLREYAFVSLFTAIGVTRESAFALGIIGSVMILLSAVPGGMLYMFFRNRDDMRQMAVMETELR